MAATVQETIRQLTESTLATLETLVGLADREFEVPSSRWAGGRGRMVEREYRQRRAERLVEIVLDLERNRGVGRIVFP